MNQHLHVTFYLVFHFYYAFWRKSPHIKDHVVHYLTMDMNDLCLAIK